MLNREQLRERLVRPVEVEVEELDGSVFVRQVTLDKRRELREREESEADFDSEVWLVVNCICDDAGELLFANGDEEWLSKHAGAPRLTALGKAVLRGNGWDSESIEEIAGN